MSSVYNLEQIFEENNIVLVDTSSFNPHSDFYSDEDNMNLENRKKILLTKISYLNKIKELVELDNFYITRDVEGEIIKGINYKDYKKKFKKKTRIVKKLLLQPELIKRQSKKLTQILNILTNNNRVVSPEIKSIKEYRHSYERHQNLVNWYKLSNTDYDLLITGLTLSFYQNKVGVVSLDKGILNAWKEIDRRENIQNKTFSAYSPNTKSYGLVVGQN
ncbi:MAG: hypothetical protein PF569_01105 [Candidatus Woesearchaeota archaeon]|jgi:rRNA maturation endonuclease Nob1|nr:hypothetical protein [Candidatus Woesearchaeota archaeon]